MELFYFRAPNGNVGDDLNPWLWSKVFSPDFFDDGPQEHVFFGIGSLLTHGSMGKRARYTVFGSGARSYFRRINTKRAVFDFRFVRGPLTSWQCGGPKWICDPAILAPRYFTPKTATKRFKIGFVAYFRTDEAITNELCERLEMRRIDSTLPVETFISQLCECELIVAEAMHGAILADAYGIPWRSIRLTGPIHEGLTAHFKWNDWRMSLGITKAAIDPYPFLGMLPDQLRRYVLAAKLDSSIDSVTAKLAKGRFFLSDRKRLEDAQDRIEEEADRLRFLYRR